MTDPIRIPVHVTQSTALSSDGSANITPDIHAQILAPLEKRIAALEAMAKPAFVYHAAPLTEDERRKLSNSQRVDAQLFVGGCLPTSAPGHTQADLERAHGADDAAVIEAMEYILENSPGATVRSGCEALLAAIRDRKFPGIYWSDDYPNDKQIAIYNEQIEALRNEVDSLHTILAGKEHEIARLKGEFEPDDAEAVGHALIRAAAIRHAAFASNTSDQRAGEVTP